MKSAPLGRFLLGQRAVTVAVALLSVWGWLQTSHFPPWGSWHAEVPFFVAILLAVWSAVGVLVRRMPQARVRLPVSAWPLIFLLALSAIQFIAGRITFFGDVVTVWLYLLLCLFSLALGYALSSRRDMASGQHEDVVLTAMALSLLATGLVSTVVAWTQVLELWDSSSWIVRTDDLRRAGGNMGQPNHLATLLTMAAASVLYLHAARRLSGFSTAAIVGFLCTGLVVTQSRAGALGWLLMLAWWGWKQPLVTSRRSQAWAVVSGVLFVAMFMVWPTLLNAIQLMGGDGGSVPTHRLAEGSLRFQVWPQLVDAMLLRPWSGWGFLQVAEAHNAVADKYPVSEAYSYAHNLLLDLALWIGLPFAVLLTALAAIWLWRRIRSTRTLVSWYGLAVALPVGVHAMLEFPHAYAYFLVPAMLALGAVEREQSARPCLSLGVKPVFGLLIIATVLMAWSAVDYLKAEEDFRVARFEMLKVGRTPADYERPTPHVLTQLGAVLEVTRIQPGPAMPAEQLERLKQVAMRYPWSEPRYRYAQALAMNGNMPEATRQMQVIRALHGERVYSTLQTQFEKGLRERHLENGGKAPS